MGLDPSGPHIPRRAPGCALLRGLLPERVHKHAKRAAGGSLPATSRHRHGSIEPNTLLDGCRCNGRCPVHDRCHGPRVVLHLLRPPHHGLFALPMGRDQVGTAMEGGEIRARGEQGGTSGMNRTSGVWITRVRLSCKIVVNYA